MLNAIIRFSIRNKLIVGLMVLGLVVAGIIQLQRLPIDALPDITSNQVQVITSSPSLAAPEVERLVTFTIEQYCSNIQGITEMRSISRFGLSVVTIVFDDATDIYWARQQVAERLTYVKDEIPAGIGMPSMAPLTTGLGEVYQYIVKPLPGYETRYSLADLRSIQDWIIRRQLLGTPGVADVSSFGGHLKQYEVAFRSERLQSMGITVNDLYTALQRNNQNSGGAYIERHGQVQFIRTEGLLQTIPDIESIMVKESENGTPVYIRDVAEVRLGKAIRYGALVDGANGEVSGAVVLMLKGANGLEVVSTLKRKMEEIRKTLPEGVVVETFYDRSKMVTRAISTVKTNLLEGALIVVLVLVLFLGNIRAGLIVASVIPLAMLFAFIMMNWLGVSGNLMSLGALDFGLIVDGAVIIVEAVLHRLHHKFVPGGTALITQSQMDDEVEFASGKMMNAAVFGQVIILIVYLPILALVGIEGKMFGPMAKTVSFALIGAFLLSLTYVPMVTSLMISKKVSTKTDFADKFMALIQKAYLPALKKALQMKWAVVLVTSLVFFISLWVMGKLGGEFIPELEEGDFAVDTRLLTGSSLTASVEANMKAANILQKRFPEVEKITIRVGASEIPTDPMPVEMSDLIILLKEKKYWTSAESYDELANKMSEALEEVPGLSAGFQFPVQMRFNELISGARQDVVCKIFGEDLDTLALYANRIGAIAGKIDGAEDIYVETVTGLPQIVVEFNRNALAAFNIHIEDVNQVIATAFAGQAAGIVYEKERRFGLVLRLAQPYRSDLSDVQNLMINTNSGTQVPLSQVATVSIKEGPNQIQRENTQRRIITAFNVRGKDVETVVEDLQKKVEAGIKLPAGYSIKYGGAFENLQAASQRLSVAVPVALLLILLLLYFAFSSIKHALLIFSAIPLSAIGGIFALYFRDMPFSISAGVGFIALFGVAVLNGIVLITEFNRLKKEGHLGLEELIMEGTKTRLRPVLMTASVASLGFLPMALSQSAGAEVQRPLASVVIGGLITATFLTLIVLPALYAWLEKKGFAKKLLVRNIGIGLLLLLPAAAISQRIIGLDEALKQLPGGNAELQLGSFRQQYLDALTETAGEMPKARIAAELGQTNSVNFDTRFMLSQTLLPFGYKTSERQFLQSGADIFKKEMVLRQAELRYMVKALFAEYDFEHHREGQLRKMDSLQNRLLVLAAQRLKAGETNRLEKAGFTQQQILLRQQLAECQMQKQRLTLQLKILLKTDEEIQMVAGYSPRYDATVLLDSAALAAHPAVMVKMEEAQSARFQTELEKARRKPELEFGYNNQSLIGYQTLRDGTDKLYNAGNRFSAAQVGLSFPLLGKASRARVKAAEVQEMLTDKAVETQRWRTLAEWQQWQMETRLLKDQLRAFETDLLPGAADITTTAEQQLKAGELNYVNWMLIAEPALQIPLRYFAKVREFNLAVANLEYYTESPGQP